MDDQRLTEDGRQPETKPPTSKKPWHAPKLTVYGTIEDITRNVGTMGGDGVLMGSMIIGAPPAR